MRTLRGLARIWTEGQMRRDPTQEEIDAVFAANDCPGPIHCKQPRTSEKLTALR